MTSTPTGRRLSSKGLLALISLVLAMSVWVLGLRDSLSRDSVAPALSLQQQEKALLAEPALPEPNLDRQVDHQGFRHAGWPSQTDIPVLVALGVGIGGGGDAA